MKKYSKIQENMLQYDIKYSNEEFAEALPAKCLQKVLRWHSDTAALVHAVTQKKLQRPQQHHTPVLTAWKIGRSCAPGRMDELESSKTGCRRSHFSNSDECSKAL